MHPYKVLKVPKNASPGRIKKAYRTAAMRHHPDRAGDPAVFQEVLLAFKILSDPARRKHYDETGEIGGQRPDNRRAELGGVLSEALAYVVGEILQKGGSLIHEDLAAHLRAAMGSALKQIRKQVGVAEKAKGAVSAALGRFSRKDDDPLMEEVLAFEMSKADKALAVLKAQEKLHADALDYLKDCTFRHDPKSPVLGTWTCVRMAVSTS